jgi:predicted phosphoribosyltransferase
MDGRYPVRFPDRSHAGRALAARLASYAERADVVVLALPRGGVPVAYEVARALGAALDVLVVRKLGVPGRPELALGAIAGGDVRVLNRELLRQLRIEGAAIDRVVDEERRELARRERAYRDDRPPLDVRGRTVILVDDGLATGATMYAAVAALERQHAARVVVAVPVASREARDSLATVADEVVCLATPEPFFGVGAWYDDFGQTTDEEVRRLLRRASDSRAPRQPDSPAGARRPA